MAKKKDKEEKVVDDSVVVADTDKSKIESIKSELNKKFSAGIAKGLEQFMDKPIQIYSMSPALDVALSGGIPEGVSVTITGRPKMGKTTIAMHAAAKMGRPIYFFPAEGRFKKLNADWAIKHGMDPELFTLVGSEEGKIMTAEDYLEAAELVLKSHPGSVIIFDSLSIIATQNEMIEGIDKQHRAPGAKLLSAFCKRMANVIPVNRQIFIGITHVMANVSGYGAAWQEKSGNAIWYANDVKLFIKQKDDWMLGDEQIGDIITVEVPNSALGKPNQKAVVYHRFGHGIDEKYEYMKMAIELGLIEKAASWYNITWVDKKFQGEEKLYQNLINSELYSELELKVKDMLA